MSAVFDALIAALGARRRSLGDWSARERDTRRFEHSLGGGGLTRLAQRTELAARIHVDTARGRGSAELLLDGPEPVDPLIDEAAIRAGAAIGPLWRSSPAGAPARVAIAERGLDAPAPIAARLLAEVRGAVTSGGGELIETRVAIERVEVALATSRGLAARWLETAIELDVTVAFAGRTGRLSRRVRRQRDLHAAEAAEVALRRAAAHATASATPVGRHAVLLPAELLGGSGAAVLDALAALADAALHRQGLARARIGAPIVDGADAAPEPLDIGSDGTLRWALRSAPLGDHGEPVRRFPIVERGVLIGLGLDEREAALRNLPANGGVRNLVLSAGASDSAALRRAGTLELHELTYVDLEPLTGRAALGIGLATLHGADRATTLISGGELQADLVAAFAMSRRSADTVTAGTYRGPSLVRLPDILVS